MKLKYLTTIFLCTLLCGQALAQEIDTELSNLADKLAAQIEQQGKTKVTVLDFTDLQGGSSELGKYIAEQLTVDLVMNKKGFSVLDRANLKSILAEHQLTAKGLIDPDTAKKFGMFAGVDAIILGTITPKDQSISLTAKIITTDTAEIIGAAKSEFNMDGTVQQLMSTSVSSNESGNSDNPSTKKKFIKFFPAFAVIIDSFRIVNGSQYEVTMTLTNQSATQLATVAIDADVTESSRGCPVASVVSDPEGYEFHAGGADVEGAAIASERPFFGFDGSVTQIKPNDSTPVTIKFSSLPGRVATPGLCHVQLQFLDFWIDGYGKIARWNRDGLIIDINTD